MKSKASVTRGDGEAEQEEASVEEPFRDPILSDWKGSLHGLNDPKKNLLRLFLVLDSTSS